MIDPDPRIDPADLRRAKFPGSFRRYDAKAVEEFLESVAERITATNELVDHLQRELDAARTVRTVEPSGAPSPLDSPDLSALPEDELVRLVGEETGHVLATARKAAADIRSKAEESAARLIREATADASRIVEEAEARAEALTTEAAGVRDEAIAEAESVAALIRDGATEEAERLLAAARSEAEEAAEAARAVRDEAEAEADAVREAAREEGRAMVNEAKEVRTRVLEDLQRRRDLGRAQLERLLAGREQVLAAYAAVRANVDEVTAELEDHLLEPAAEPALDEGFVGVVSTVGAESAPDDDAAAEPLPDEPVAAEAVTALERVEDAAQPEPATDAGEPDTAVEEATDEAPEPVADAAEPAPGTAGGQDADLPPDASADDVDALFARIRTEREASVARAQQVLAGDADDPADAPAVVLDRAPADVEAAAGAAGADVDHVDPALLADPDALTGRQEALDPLDRRLSRALKRRLADEQNEVLDALRRTESTDVGGLLPEFDAHLGSYADVATKVLAAAAAAGAASIGGGADVDVTGVARALGETIVEPFRRRVERSAADVDGDADAFDERLRAVYREWKVEHVGAAGSDALLSAYALGQLTAVPEDASVTWRIDPTQGPCPDAQDNALAGAIPKGETFPTGDRCPQAHPGCRCLLGLA